MSPKQERERRIAERYLLARQRARDGAWARQPVRLTSRDRPDVRAEFAHGPTIGIEVTEFVCPRRARLRRFEALVASDVRSLLDATGTSGWFGVDADGGPLSVGAGRTGAELNAQVVASLAAEIERAGGVDRLVEGLPRGSWRFEYRDTHSGRRATAVLDFERTPAARGWRRRSTVRQSRLPSSEQERAEKDLVSLVAKKTAQARRYPWGRHPLHLVVLHARAGVRLGPTCLRAVRSALASGPFAEAWLLRSDLAAPEVRPDEPRVLRLDRASSPWA